MRAEGCALAPFKQALMGLRWRVQGSVSTKIRGEKIVAKYITHTAGCMDNRKCIFIVIIEVALNTF